MKVCPACGKPLEPIIYTIRGERTPLSVYYYFCDNRSCTYYISNPGKKGFEIVLHDIGEA